MSESHPSILTIKENVPVDHSFQFEKCQVSEVLRKISELVGSKNDTFKKYSVCAQYLTKI